MQDRQTALRRPAKNTLVFCGRTCHRSEQLSVLNGGFSQIRSVQRSSGRGRRRDTFFSGAKLLQWASFNSTRSAISGWATAGQTCRTESETGSAKLAGESASLNEVSGSSTIGTANAQTRVPTKKRTNNRYVRFTTEPNGRKDSGSSRGCQEKCVRETLVLRFATIHCCYGSGAGISLNNIFSSIGLSISTSGVISSSECGAKP